MTSGMISKISARRARRVVTKLLFSNPWISSGVPLITLLLGLPWLPIGSLALAQEGDALSQKLSLETPDGIVQLRPVGMVMLPALEPTVKEALLAQRRRLASLVKSGKASISDFAQGYGEMGALYQAHNMYMAAEPCYLNAEMLAPNEFRWAYYLGYLYTQMDHLQKAAVSLERALKINPDYGPGQLRLAHVYIDLNDHPRAEQILGKTVQIEALRVVSLFYLGQIALAQHAYPTAINLFEKVLRERPEDLRIHYLLAMAYRASGDFDRAQTHLAQYGEGQPKIIDPEVDKLEKLISGACPHFLRANRALKKHDYPAVVEALTLGLKFDPENVEHRVSLARSLYLTGDRDGALAQLGEVLRLAPEHALAHFLMGVLLEAEGDVQAAELHYRSALAADPEQGGALHYLGNAMMRKGRYAEAAQYYAGAVRQFPSDTSARLMEVLALYRAGVAHKEIIRRLEEAVSIKPDQKVIAAVLARFLAASADDTIRDGPRALALAQKIMSPFPVAEEAETLAMAYAEMGRYEEAVSQQNSAITAALLSSRGDLLPRLEGTLALYKEGKPCREPLADNDPIFMPSSPDPVGPFSYYPSGTGD
jgi:tetratricopeptide (TPR) repeat protein